MIGTDRLLFLHLHKSGGTFVNLLLMRCVPSARQLGYHLPYREVPDAYRDRAVVGTVRNPWAYYVSWYHFQIAHRQPNLLFRICSNEGQLDFRGTIANLVNLSADERRLGLLEEGLPNTYANRGLNLTKSCVAELRERGVGFYSFLYERLYAGATEPRILRVEHLREELHATLSSFGYLPNACAENFLDEAPPINVSRHEEPYRYFNEALAELVSERDRTIIERYGYSL